MPERPSISISDLTRLQEQERRPQTLTAEDVQDYAVAALVVLRGMRRGDQLRVIRRMRRLLD